MSKPDLSVAIIFKNEIRCLERCLKSLQPLRERLSLQIVMADTGATDGSRAVAEQYADELFDFTWVNDFAAARNAVLERCEGRWALVIDCDEWLDDGGELSKFLASPRARQFDRASIIIRNYTDAAFEEYEEFPVVRLMRLDVKPRYEGAIHETPVFSDKNVGSILLGRTLLHHDGYVMLNDGSKEGDEKRRRNLVLLRADLEANPRDLRQQMQLLEIGNKEQDYEDQIRKAVSLVEEKETGWDSFGPPILRLAVYEAYTRKLRELDQWEQMAEEWFPESYFTRLDLSFLFMERAFTNSDYEKAISCGRTYLDARAAFDKDLRGAQENSISLLCRNTREWELFARVRLAESYQKLGQSEAGVEILRGVSWDAMLDRRIPWTLRVLKLLHADGCDVSTLLPAFWDGISVKKPNQEYAKQCEQSFLNVGAIFLNERQEIGKPPVWKMFLPLRGKCSVGDAAALMAAETPEEADALLADFDDLTELPAAAFVHALKVGAEFPLPGRLLPMELADVMANKLSTDAAFLREAAIFAAQAFESDADLNWARSLTLAALQANDWKTDLNPTPLLRAFVRVESAFLGRCYTTRALDYAAYLPPLHRFGLHLANAYAVLSPATVSPEFTPTVKSGMRGALAELKEAVVAAPEQKAVIDVVLDAVSGGTL